ncbi:S41 family peptidase [Bacillus sp. SCS-151]|uniref:S41 family peptidase n=1 Tax=Nanhaiella sioensis TaxID=3115293 RepID=UPI003977F0EB
MNKFKKIIVMSIAIMLFVGGYFIYHSINEESTISSKVINSNETVAPEPISNERMIENITAFTKLFGYIQYFHPSDEVTQIDWNNFAIYGVKEVKDARNDKELKEALLELFTPIAPTLIIFENSEKANVILPEVPDNKEQLETVAWGHTGLGTGDWEGYSSERFYANYSEQLLVFNKELTYGSTITKSLSSNLQCTFPLVLLADNKKTVGTTRSSLIEFSELEGKLIDFNYSFRDTKLAAVVAAWNAIQHFYPYFDVIEVDWNQQLEETLMKTLSINNTENLVRELKLMLEKLQDGHAYVSKIGVHNSYLPFAVDFLEDQLIVSNVSTESELQVGDIVISINNRDVIDVLLEQESLISGSSRYKRERALQEILWREEGSTSTATIEVNRNGDIIQLQEVYSNIMVDKYIRPIGVTEFEEDIFYVNMNNLKLEEINPKVDELAMAKGIVFDLRGYPDNSSSVPILQHITDQPIESQKWMRPQYIYPDREMVAGYSEEYRWYFEPLEPRFKGEIVFLTDGSAISFAESIMSIVKYYDLGEIIGQSTAGSNGNINILEIPGNIVIGWTGMKVLKHDNSQHHLIGIQPTIPLERTTNGIKEGKDEYIEKALEVIKQQ